MIEMLCPVTIRRRSLLATLAVVPLLAIECDRFDLPNDDGPPVGTAASMDVWLDLMPTFPPASERQHVLVEAEFVNLSDEPVLVDLEVVYVRRVDDDSLLFVFVLQPQEAWDERLAPGAISNGRWIKSHSTAFGQPECGLPVRGTIVTTVRTEGDRRPYARRVDVGATTLACVY
ncbi:MAG: hypothetical protein GY716_07790 [bacterium]|nr:hypothetical protein [bacterium]